MINIINIRTILVDDITVAKNRTCKGGPKNWQTFLYALTSYAVVLFSVVDFKTLTFHKVVWQHTWGMVGSLMYYYKCSLDSDSEIILKIGQYLTKLRRTKQSVPFFGTTL